MKEKARKIAKKILAKESKKANLIAHDRLICEFLDRWITQKGFKNILLFSSMIHEVNLFKLIVKLRKRGIRVYLPKLLFNERAMQISLFRLPLQKGEFGIQNSGSSKFYPMKLDLAVVPILGFDLEMRRIGFGKGYYDCFFKKDLDQPYIIFVSRNLLFAKMCITGSYDLKADMVLSSRTRIQSKRGSKNGVFGNKFYFFNRCCFDRNFYHF